MLNKSTLKRINERPGKAQPFPLIAIGAGAVVLAALLIMFTSSISLALAPLLAGALGILLASRIAGARGATTLNYSKLNGETAVHFSAVQKACEALSGASMIWSLKGGEARAPGATGIVSTPERTPARVGLLETPGIRANVPIWGIDAGETKLFFFPEAVLLYRNERYEGVSYKSVKAAFSLVRFFEKEDVPEDAKVIERAWRQTGQNSGRYRAYGSNPQTPVVLYGLLEIALPGKAEVRLQISNPDASARFARAFGAEDAEKAASHEEAGGESRAYTGPSMEERARTASARRILGVKEDASMGEISAAYRKMARTYHPDKVMDQSEEVREFAEQRMMEINAAYAELKLHLEHSNSVQQVR